MKTYLIKINKNTIKLNENFGSTTTSIYIGKTIKFKSKYLPNNFIDGENCIILNWEENNGKKMNIEGELFNEDLIKKCIGEKRGDIKIEIQSNYKTINHFPISKYIYSYKNTKIKCLVCGKQIMTYDLRNEESEDDEYYSNKICPKCSAFDCCFLEYENINDIVNNI